jgi:hypothetical protein
MPTWVYPPAPPPEPTVPVPTPHCPSEPFTDSEKFEPTEPFIPSKFFLGSEAYTPSASELQSGLYTETEAYLGSEAYLSSQTLQESESLKSSSFTDTALFLASMRFSWIFVTAEGTGAVYPPEEQVISITVDLLPLYVMFGLMCAINLGSLIYLIYDHTEFGCLRRKIDDEVVPLKEAPTEKLSETFELADEEEEEKRELFQNDTLTAGEFRRKMLKE